jgi:hypothetical protein
MIDKLTTKQVDRLAHYREEGLRIGLSTMATTHYDKAFDCIGRAYDVAGLKPPTIRVVLPSPLHGCYGAILAALKRFLSQLL